MRLAVSAAASVLSWASPFACSFRGFSNLMVADASIFRDHIMNNTNLTCHVVGEVATDVISGNRASGQRVATEVEAVTG